MARETSKLRKNTGIHVWCITWARACAGMCTSGLMPHSFELDVGSKMKHAYLVFLKPFRP